MLTGRVVAGDARAGETPGRDDGHEPGADNTRSAERYPGSSTAGLLIQVSEPDLVNNEHSRRNQGRK
jgi:hypothetical protein